MCAPANTDVLLRLRREPLAKMPISIVLESGSEKLTAHSPPCARKRGLIDMIKTALFFGSFLAMLFLRGNGVLVNNVLVNRINKLTGLASFDRLKKEFVDDELEIHWDRQHIHELQDGIESMQGGFRRTALMFHKEEEDLAKKNESLREALLTTSELNDEIQEFDRMMLKELSKQAGKFHIRLAKEMTENHELRRLLSETMKEMHDVNVPIPQLALRGSQ